jgi:probable selenium-dependent hydroxylase accessory protein YqeC
MYELARIAGAMGHKVLVSTTTHIMEPDRALFAENMEQVRARWAQGKIAVVGQRTQEKKLSGLSTEELTPFLEEADMVFLEADGSKRLPFKVPSQKEPVLIPESDIVLAVAGLSALGHPLREKCFRIREATDLLGKSDEEPIEEEDMARVLISPQGSKKGVGKRQYKILLNQCDGEREQAQVARIAALIRKLSGGHEEVFATSFTQGKGADRTHGRIYTF